MKNQTRFIRSITRTAAEMTAPGAETQIAMPWHRGAPRAAFIEKRSVPASQLKRASA